MSTEFIFDMWDLDLADEDLAIIFSEIIDQVEIEYTGGYWEAEF